MVTEEGVSIRGGTIESYLIVRTILQLIYLIYL